MQQALKSCKRTSIALDYASLNAKTQYYYTPREIQLRNNRSGYYVDPNDVLRRFVKLIALHDAAKEPHKITL